MEVNKEQAEICRDRGAQALKSGDYARSVKMLEKSLRLYPLPGVEALLAHAKVKIGESTTTTSSQQPSAETSSPRNNTSNDRASNGNTGSDGRPYTEDQSAVVRKVLHSKKSGRKAHYRILGIEESATESEIKKAYRKLSLKVHPDKNSAPQADEAFKAVSLAYATLSDANKRVIYDRYGEEDPDNRAGSGGGGVHMRHGGQEMSPEDIFNAFFGNMQGMPQGRAGGPGMHFYTNGFGPGFHFQAGGPRGRQRNGEGQQQQSPGLSLLFQLLPLLLLMFFSFSSQFGNSTYEGQYYSLTHAPPFVHPAVTKYSRVTNIPYFISTQFKHHYFSDRKSRKKIEDSVETAYENFLVNECRAQKEYKRRLVKEAEATWNANSREQKLRKAKGFELNRCDELKEFFPDFQRRSRF